MAPGTERLSYSVVFNPTVLRVTETAQPLTALTASLEDTDPYPVAHNTAFNSKFRKLEVPPIEMLSTYTNQTHK